MATERRRRGPFSAMGIQAMGIIAISSAACDGGPFGPKEFTIQVDSVSAPASISAGDTLTVRFFGTVGSSGCFRLARVEKEVTASRMELRFVGEKRGGDCFQMPVHLDREECMPPPLGDPFNIRVIQPSGAPLERIVRVQ